MHLKETGIEIEELEIRGRFIDVQLVVEYATEGGNIVYQRIVEAEVKGGKFDFYREPKPRTAAKMLDAIFSAGNKRIEKAIWKHEGYLKALARDEREEIGDLIYHARRDEALTR